MCRSRQGLCCSIGSGEGRKLFPEQRRKIVVLCVGFPWTTELPGEADIGHFVMEVAFVLDKKINAQWRLHRTLTDTADLHANLSHARPIIAGLRQYVFARNIVGVKKTVPLRHGSGGA